MSTPHRQPSCKEQAEQEFPHLAAQVDLIRYLATNCLDTQARAEARLEAIQAWVSAPLERDDIEEHQRRNELAWAEARAQELCQARGYSLTRTRDFLPQARAVSLLALVLAEGQTGILDAIGAEQRGRPAREWRLLWRLSAQVAESMLCSRAQSAARMAEACEEVAATNWRAEE